MIVCGGLAGIGDMQQGWEEECSLAQSARIMHILI